MNNVDVCLSPDLIHLFSLKNKVVVVVDIFRATSVMCTALNHGVTEIIPVSDLNELKYCYKQFGLFGLSYIALTDVLFLCFFCYK